MGIDSYPTTLGVVGPALGAGLSLVWLLTGPCSVCCQLGHYTNFDWLIDWLIDSIECHSCLNICIFTDKSLFGRKASSLWPVVFVWIRRKKVQLWTPRIRTVCWSSYEGKSVILVDETWRSLFMELTTTSGLTGCKMYGVNGCIWPHTHTQTPF